MRIVGKRLCRLLCTMQSKLDAFFAPPGSVRGMRQLDRAAFRRQVMLPAVFLRDATACSKFLRRLQHVVLRYPRIKSVRTTSVGEGGKEDKVVLLTPEPCLATPLSPEDLQWISDNGDSDEIPTGFEVVGHIAHLNLRKEFLPYKALIGEVVLDQQSTLRTVVNKTDSIDNTFRFFKMELLAGEDDMVTTVHENGCSFTFDFSKVYWNSRLHTEHERVVGMVKRGDVVLDVFAGVGPFSIPAAKKGCTVYANDLNPCSYEALVQNAKNNKVKLNTFNTDGSDFLKMSIPQLIEETLKQTLCESPAPVICTHVIMNLPAIAHQFLHTFWGLFRSVPHNRRAAIALPTVHCYCFSKSETPDKDSRELVEKSLGVCLREGSFRVLKVRLVAPNKAMMRVSFTLPREVAYSEDIHGGVSTQVEDLGDFEPDVKRVRTE